MPPETLGGQYLQQYFILGGRESFAYRALWFQGKLKEKVLQSFNLWHFSPFSSTHSQTLTGLDVSSFVQLKLSETQWDGMLKWHQSCQVYHREGFDTWPLATSKNPHSKHPPEITPIVKSIKRAEYYIKKEVWTVLCHVMIGFKKQGEAYKSLQTLHCWGWRRKAPEEPGCQVTQAGLILPILQIAWSSVFLCHGFIFI